MSEKRWRANLVSDTVDEIEIVNETDQMVDVRYPASGGWGAKVRREAKETSYSVICKTPEQAWCRIAAYAQSHLEQAEAAIARWTRVKADAESKSAKQTD